MLARWDPFRDMMVMRNQMDRLLNDWSSPGTEYGEGAGSWQQLPLDVSESNDAYTVIASIPGMNPEDLDISVQNNTLTIRGESKSEQERQGERWHIRERRMGQFQRTIALPNNVNANQVGASYENGVLTLTLPKSEEAKPRRISVQQGSQQNGGAQNQSQQNGSQRTIEGKAESKR